MATYSFVKYSCILSRRIGIETRYGKIDVNSHRGRELAARGVFHVFDAIFPRCTDIPMEKIICSSVTPHSDEWGRLLDWMKADYRSSMDIARSFPMDRLHAGHIFKAVLGKYYGFYIVSKLNDKVSAVEWRGWFNLDVTFVPVFDFLYKLRNKAILKHVNQSSDLYDERNLYGGAIGCPELDSASLQRVG